MQYTFTAEPFYVYIQPHITLFIFFILVVYIFCCYKELTSLQTIVVITLTSLLILVLAIFAWMDSFNEVNLVDIVNQHRIIDDSILKNTENKAYLRGYRTALEHTLQTYDKTSAFKRSDLPDGIHI